MDSRPRDAGASTVELALFFTLVAIILAAVFLFLNGTLPQVFAAARLANALESTNIVRPRLGALRTFRIPISNELTSLPVIVPANSDASNYERDNLLGLLDLASPAVAERNACLSLFKLPRLVCSLENPLQGLKLSDEAECEPAKSIPCITAQAEALLATKDCGAEDAGENMLVAMYPKTGDSLKGACAVTEAGMSRIGSD